jgi:hypothetical protein
MTDVVLPNNVHDFVQSESGSQLLLLLLERAVGTSIARIKPTERAIFAREFDMDSTVEMDLELLLDHLSLIRVVANMNRRAEESLIDYWAAENGRVFLMDARNYAMDALRIAPREHPERARAYKNLAYIFLAKKKTKSACDLINKATHIFQQHGLMEPIDELLEMLSTRTESECKLLQANVAAVLREMEAERS